MNGAALFLHLLAEHGIRYLFGNPGSTELPLNDALPGQSRIEYILGLQEVPVMAMADGYAQATGEPAVVNLHTSCGLGNAMGMLYNSWISSTPLIVTAGQQDRRLRFDDPVLTGENVEVARSWTKWAAEVNRVEDLPAAVRRAVHTALTPPRGPVFLSLPLDMMTDEFGAPAPAAGPRPDTRTRPPEAAVRRAAEVLLQAERPVILAGCRVTEAGATSELAAVAEALGAPVYTEMASNKSRMAIASDHPLHAGALPLWSPDIRRVLERHDAALIAGMDFLRLYIYHEPANPVPDGLRLVQMDDDPAQVAKNFPVEVGFTGGLRASLAELAALLPGRSAPAPRTPVLAQDREQLRRQIADQAGIRPMTAQVMNGVLADLLPADAAVIDEAVSTNQNLLARLGALRDPAGYFSHRGWALGWGLGCALGVKLAWPGRPVLALLGDGAALYGIQGLWTAAHYRIPVVFVICNNAGYGILKMCGDLMGLPRMSARDYVGMDLTAPAIDYPALARSFGVEAHRVTEPAELRDRVRDGLHSNAPLLLDVPLGE